MELRCLEETVHIKIKFKHKNRVSVPGSWGSPWGWGSAWG